MQNWHQNPSKNGRGPTILFQLPWQKNTKTCYVMLYPEIVVKLYPEMDMCVCVQF